MPFKVHKLHFINDQILYINQINILPVNYSYPVSICILPHLNLPQGNPSPHPPYIPTHVLIGLGFVTLGAAPPFPFVFDVLGLFGQLPLGPLQLQTQHQQNLLDHAGLGGDHLTNHLIREAKIQLAQHFSDPD